MRLMQLDVRGIAPWQRHPLIFSAFDGAADGDTLHIIVDHEPRPLRMQFEALRSGRFVWSTRNLGDRWEAAITRLGGAFPPIDPAPLIARCTPFARCSARTRERLLDLAKTRTLVRDEILFTQGEHWPSLAIVAEGALALVGTGEDGRETVLFEALPLQLVNAAAVLDGGTTLAVGRVFSPHAVIVLLPREEVAAAVASDAALARELSVIVAQQTRALAERLVAQVSKSTRARVAAAILPYAPPDLGLTLVLPPLDTLSHAHLAATAGTVREVVARTLGTFEAAGAIAREGGRIVRTDRARLSAFL
ncbi:MAG TPA: DUF2249 domain-containing protein [Candidatus Limnocylindria bacterium]|nr:DUF2249 domain-containing protein [Candidatus Limnocylindria bacterium]